MSGKYDSDGDPLEELARLIGSSGPFELLSPELERRQRADTQALLYALFGPHWQLELLACFLGQPLNR